MPSADERILSISQITREIKDMLADAYPGVWVKGELSGFKGANASGHMYFSLKDSNAKIDGVLFRGSAMRLTFIPKDGDEVEAFGEISVYEPRGNYQLVIKQMRPAGKGALMAQYEELRRRLEAEGLFDTARKQPLPAYPLTIGLVTSPLGAVIRDMVKVLRGRWPGLRLVLAPVKVQGEGSAAEIVAAIEQFDAWGQADLLIVGRGGGSIEDLWAFNEEPVVRAIAAARTPIISAVGHETNTTLADFAADLRAATPSNAAEIAVKDVRELRRLITLHSNRTRSLIRTRLERLRASLTALLKQHGFRRVKDLFITFQQRTDDLRARLDEGIRDRLTHERERLQRARGAYAFRGALPRRLEQTRRDLDQHREALDDAIVARFGLAGALLLSRICTDDALDALAKSPSR